jgi:hypothetical protein
MGPEPRMMYSVTAVPAAAPAAALAAVAACSHRSRHITLQEVLSADSKGLLEHAKRSFPIAPSRAMEHVAASSASFASASGLWCPLESPHWSPFLPSLPFPLPPRPPLNSCTRTSPRRVSPAGSVARTAYPHPPLRWLRIVDTIRDVRTLPPLPVSGL